MEGARGENQLSASSTQARVEPGVKVDGVDLVDAVDRVELVRVLGRPVRVLLFGRLPELCRRFLCPWWE